MDPTNSQFVGRVRWILTGVLLLLTMVGTVAAVFLLPRTYQSQSSVVLLASRVVAKPNGNNPYLSFSPSLTLTADVVSRELMSPGTVSHLAALGFPDSYTVALAPFTTLTTGSVLLVTVSGHDKPGVERTLHGVTSGIGTVLAKLQSGSTPAERVRMAIISMTGQATLSVTQTARSFVVLAGFGLAFSFVVPWIAAVQVAHRLLGFRAGLHPRTPQPPRPGTGDKWTPPEHAAPEHAAHSGSSSAGGRESGT
jgi:hypothetical protein